MLSVWLSALAGGFLYFALHLTASGSFPRPLTAAQERECLQKIKEGDQQARDYFIEHNLRLVAHIIKKYYASYKEQEDLISIGTIGLIKQWEPLTATRASVLRPMHLDVLKMRF